MSTVTSRPTRPRRLPKGIAPGGLGARFLAYVIDGLVPLVVYAGVGVGLWFGSTPVRIVTVAAGALVLLGWLVFLWYRLAVAGVSPGMAVVKLELIAYRSGRPLGWGNVLLRAIVFAVLSATGVGWIVLVILMLIDPLHQGPHDRAVQAVMIGARTKPGRAEVAAPAERQRPASNTVGLPAHLTGGSNAFAPQAPQSASERANAPWANGQKETAGQPPAELGEPWGTGPWGSGQWQGGQWQGGSGEFGQQNAPGQPWGPSAQDQARGQSQQQGPDSWQGQPQPGQPLSGQPRWQGSAPERATSQERPAEAPSEAPELISNTPFGGPKGRPEQTPLDAGESTRLVPKRGGTPQRPADQGWVVAFDDGRQVSLAGLVLVGRDPSPRPGENVNELVCVTDNSRTVSKTHIAVGVDSKGVYIMDRGSTNGSAIATASGKYEPCAAGDLVRVREGQIVSFGDHRMEIRRSY